MGVPLAVQAADDLPRGDTVASRVRPELDPIGIHAGAYRLYPSLQIGLERVDNIFAQEQNPVDDRITRLEPALVLQSDWNRHSVRGSVSADVARYADNASEDYNDYRAEARGRLDVLQGSEIDLGGEYALEHEDRGSPDDVSGFEPTRYQESSVFASTLWNRGRWRFVLDAAVEWIFYEDVSGSAGIINNEDRDRVEQQAGAEAAYEILPRRSVFIRAHANQRDYRQEVDDFGLNRDSTGSDIVAGARVEFSGVTGGEAYVGQLAQDYQDPALPSLDDTTFGASFYWSPTGLTTLTTTLDRRVDETTFDGASSVRVTTARLRVDHELFRNLILSGQAQVWNELYTGISRDDDYDDYVLEARYLMNRNMEGRLRFHHDRRDSDAAGEDYSRNRVLVTLKGQL
jgi:hypothetical protein